jgi:hypothetical protein
MAASPTIFRVEESFVTLATASASFDLFDEGGVLHEEGGLEDDLLVVEGEEELVGSSVSIYSHALLPLEGDEEGEDDEVRGLQQTVP